MAITIVDIQPYDNMSDEDVAITLNSLGITRYPIPAQSFLDLLRETKFARKGLNGEWIGPLADAANDINLPVELREAIIDLLSHLSTPGAENVLTNVNPYGQLMQITLETLQVPDEVRDMFNALGGGLKYSNITSEEIKNVREAYIIQLTKQQNNNTIIALANSKMAAALLVVEQGGSIDDALKAFDEAK